ncbi:MAG: DUF3990 domain-containing protein [Prevotella sp.]|nr:DUF3990 domain-containing protein [Prevotella sp.]
MEKDFEQAKKWSLLKQKRSGSAQAIVTGFWIDDGILQSPDYKILFFESATKEWLDFVVNNRRGTKIYDYEMVMGPVANDSLYATLLLFEQGILSVDAAIEQLKTHTLFDRLSFHTEKAIALLNFSQVHLIKN